MVDLGESFYLLFTNTGSAYVSIFNHLSYRQQVGLLPNIHFMLSSDFQQD